jgi:hypothetical protein
VADAADPDDPLAAVRQRTELAPEVVDVRVDAAVEGREFAAEHALHERLAADRLARARGQRLEQIEFHGRQVEPLGGEPRRSGACVDLEIDGSTIAFAVEGEEQNRYSGTLAGDEIEFQVKYPSHENGTRIWPFVATRKSGGPAASQPQAATVDGEWEGEVSRGGRVIPARFTFHADGAVLTGNVQAVGDDFPIVKGTIAGASIAFKVLGFSLATGRLEAFIGSEPLASGAR